ncbi:MAG: hypothetical protein LBV79_06790 [Candidatus Adiutrix sp.]|jgi:hypothetical protein|nr:hypothetical protein [Candidatus Adiutrix sp.]
MATSVVWLYNMALGWLGGHQLPSVQAAWENSTIGELCQAYYPQLLLESLEAKNWSFATKSQDLSLKPGPGREGYRLRYGLPSDYLRAVRLEGGGLPGGPSFIIEGDDLLTNAEPARLVFVFRLEDPKRFPPAFTSALAYGLAAFLAPANANDQRDKADCQQKYVITLEEAWARDRQAQRPAPRPSAWQTARHGGFGPRGNGDFS